MRRVLAVVVLLLVLGVTALGAVPDEAAAWASDVRQQLEGTTITVLAISHPSIEAYQEMTADFTAATGITVQWDLTETDRINSKEFLEHSAGSTNYDVFMVNGVSITEFSAKGVLEPLDGFLADSSQTPDWFDYEDIIPAYRNGLGMVDGVVLGIPTAGESFFISYRKDLFDKYDVKPPQTVDELLRAARFFHNREPGLSGIATRGLTGRHLGAAWSTIVYQFGGAYVDQTTWVPTMTNVETKFSLMYLLELLQYAPPGIETFTWEEETTAYISGHTAMWFDATALQPWIEDPEKSVIVGKAGYLPPPEGPAGRFGALAGWVMGLPANSAQKQAGWAFLMYMTSRLMAPEYVANGGVISRTSSLQDPAYRAANPEFVDALEATYDAANNLIAEGLRWIPPHPDAGKIQERAGYYAGLALTGELTIEEALERAQADIGEILADD